MGVLGGYLYWKVVLEFWFGHPKCHFRYPQNSQKHPFWAFWGVPKMALRVPESKFWDHFYRPKPPPKPPKRHLRNPNRTSKSDFWPFFYFGHFPIEIPIEVEKMLGRAFQTCNLKNKNCSELLLTKGMGLDRAPFNFLTLIFSPLEVDPPNHPARVVSLKNSVLKLSRSNWSVAELCLNAI